jgi:hypothetical protein
VYLWGLDAPVADDLSLDQLDRAELTGSGGVLFVYQALCRARAAGFLPGRLWLVTRNAQDVGTAEAATGLAQAPLWGLGRTIALETPAIWGGLVDLPPTRRGTAGRDASALAAELLSPDGEDQIALREGKRFVARLGRLALDASSPASRRRAARVRTSSRAAWACSDSAWPAGWSRPTVCARSSSPDAARPTKKPGGR